MRYFKIIHALAVAHLNPSVKEGEVKFIPLATLCNTNQLCCASLSAYRGIKRRSKHGSKQKVYTVSPCRFYEIFHDFPVFFRPNLNIVVVCKAVRVEPLCKINILLWKHRINNLNVDGAGYATRVSGIKGKCHSMLACRNIIGKVKFHPYRVKCTPGEGEAAIIVKRLQNIGEHSRLCTQIIVITAAVVHCLCHGYGENSAHRHTVLQVALNLRLDAYRLI